MHLFIELNKKNHFFYNTIFEPNHIQIEWKFLCNLAQDALLDFGFVLTK